MPSCSTAWPPSSSKSGFDRKHRHPPDLQQPDAYQRSAATNSFNEEDEALFSHARVRRLSAEQLQDAIGGVTGALKPVEACAAEQRKLEASLKAERERVGQDQPAWEKTSRDKVLAMPRRAGVWSVVGPFPDGKPAKGHAEVFPPENGFTLADHYRDGKLKWVRRVDWEDARPFPLPGAAGVFYLAGP